MSLDSRLLLVKP